MEKWQRNLLVMWLAQLVGMMSISCIVSFISLFINVELGVTDLGRANLWSGILVSVTPLLAAVFGPVWGELGDRYGRKAMVLRVLAANFLIIGLMGLARNIPQVLFLRSVQGLFTGFSAAALALVTSIVPEAQLGYALGVYQTAMIAGNAAGPLLGGLLADLVGFRGTFGIMGILSLVSALLVWGFVSEEFRPVDAGRGEGLLAGIKAVMAGRELLPLAVSLFLIQFANMTLAPILPLFIKGLGAPDRFLASTAGFILAAGGLTGAVAAVIAGRRGEQWGYPAIIVWGSAGTAALYLVTAGVQTTGQLTVLRLLVGFTLGGILPSANALIGRRVPAERRGVAYGLTTSSSLMGNVLGPLFGGALAAVAGPRSVFLFTAGMFVLASLWVQAQVKGVEEQSK